MIGIVFLAVGYGFGYLNHTVTTTQTFNETAADLHPQLFQFRYQTLTQTTVISESGRNVTYTVVRSLPAQTITEYVVVYTGTEGGQGSCVGSFPCLSAVEIEYSATTTYIIPLTTVQGYANATFTQVTSYHYLSCTSPTTSYTTRTISGNTTEVSWTWTQTCST